MLAAFVVHMTHGTIRFRPFMPAFTIRIGVKP